MPPLMTSFPIQEMSKVTHPNVALHIPRYRHTTPSHRLIPSWPTVLILSQADVAIQVPNVHKGV